jgi:hypothetical protein
MCVNCVVYIANGDEPEATHCFDCGGPASAAGYCEACER